MQNSFVSPAKINLGLRIGAKRPEDSYHYIHSIFIPISFGDKICITPIQGESGRLPEDRFSSVNELPGPAAEDFEKVSERRKPEKNLLVQALKQTRPYRRQALHVHIHKRIPTGSGLGGGSSNAGRLLCYILHHRLFLKQPGLIRKIAFALGSDVPFFLHNKAAIVSGVGERIALLELRPAWGVLALSYIKINTQQAYGLLKRALHTGSPPKNLLGINTSILQALKNSYWDLLSSLKNDFEAPVFSLFPELQSIKESFLEGGAQYVSMSGSGSSLYALVNCQEKQHKLRDMMAEKFVQYDFVPFCFRGVLP